jgi:hypothetical protein
VSNRKRKDKQRRTALSPRNIIEYAMEQCKKVKDRNRSLQPTALKTPTGILATVVCISPTTEQE